MTFGAVIPQCPDDIYHDDRQSPPDFSSSATTFAVLSKELQQLVDWLPLKLLQTFLLLYSVSLSFPSCLTHACCSRPLSFSVWKKEREKVILIQHHISQCNHRECAINKESLQSIAHCVYSYTLSILLSSLHTLKLLPSISPVTSLQLTTFSTLHLLV